MLSFYAGAATCLLLSWGSPLVAAQSSHPESTTWAVQVTANSRCKDSPAFVSTLASQIPVAQREVEDRAELVARISIGQELAHISVFDRVLQAEAGARELPLTSRACDDIADAVALVIAVMVEAGRGPLTTGAPASPVQPPPQPPAPPAPPPEVPAPTQPAGPAAPASSTAPRRVRRGGARHVWLGPRAGHDLHAAAGLSFGLLPSIALGGTVGWGIRPAGTWPIWLHATGWQQRESADGRARFRTLYGGLSTCPLHVSRPAWRMRACALVSAGVFWAEGRRLPGVTNKLEPLVLPGVELGLHARIVGPLEFAALARLEGSLLRPRFVYDAANGGRPTLHQPSVIVGNLFAGLALRFR
jgi:hypothetical protein